MKAEINMKKSIAAFLKGIISVSVVLVFVIAISGCQKEERAMEKVGEQLGKGPGAAKDAIKKASVVSHKRLELFFLPLRDR
jgi:hypothetical protein